MEDETFLKEDAFRGRTVIVTGGAGSFGRILCWAFAKAGANVVVNDLGGSFTGQGSSSEPAESLAKELRTQGFSAIADTHDILDGQRIVDAALQAFGRVDVLINNAGIQNYGAFEELSSDSVRQVIEVNAIGPALLCHAIWPLFKNQGYGRIVNITSASILGMAPAFTPYVTSKAALVGLTKSLAAEVRQLDKIDIKVNAVAPIAYSRMTAQKSQELSDAFNKAYPAAGNVAVILALALEGCSVSGEIFNTGGYKVNRLAYGILPGIQHASSAEELLTQQDALLGTGRSLVEQSSTESMMQWTMTDSQRF